MWGHAYVESNDAIVLCIISLCFALHHTAFNDAFWSCMSFQDSTSFLSMC